MNDKTHSHLLMSRRRLLNAAAAGGLSVPLLAGFAQKANAAQTVNSTGISLPEDAAPADKQIFRLAGIEGKHFDQTKNIYESSGMNGYAWEPLIWLDGDYVAYPGGADSWETSDDGLTWTFQIRQNSAWSDGTPITAADWVYSLQRMLSPEVANPYAWFYASIKNATPYNAGELTDVSQLGVQQIDDYTLAITTEQPIPYFLQILGFIPTIAPKHMIEAHGDAWASDPATALSNGPYMVQEWNKGRDVVFALNPHYQGPALGLVETIVDTFLPQSGAQPIPMYQANEVDWLYLDNGANVKLALSNEDTKKELDTFPAFTTYYMFFNTDEPPFDDLRVRQAFSHAIDRETIANQVMQGLDVPAYTMLPDGFPFSQADDPDIQAIQAYDPEKAKALMAEAGYPNGDGFPEFEMWTRQGQIVAEAEAIQRMLQDNLGIKVQSKDIERSVYMDKLGAHEIPLGLIQWAGDYADPTNFLDWWTTQSRHTWKNDEFNELVSQARGELDTDKRRVLYNQAERILIEDVGGVFIANPVWGELWKPTVAGIRETARGVRAHYNKMWSDLYMREG